jgi:hypothetical protein
MDTTQEYDTPGDGVPEPRAADPVSDLPADERERAADRREVEITEREIAADTRESDMDERARIVTEAIDAADQRDVSANLRDRAARARDDAANARDHVAEDHEAAGEFHDGSADRLAAGVDRRVAGANRHFAAVDRDWAAGDRALLLPMHPQSTTIAWLIHVVFNDGEGRYYKRLDAHELGEFTVQRDQAHRCRSEAEAWDIADRFSARYRRIRQITVEETPQDPGSADR